MQRGSARRRLGATLASMKSVALAVVACHVSILVVLFGLASEADVDPDDPQSIAPAKPNPRLKKVLFPVCATCAGLAIAGIWVPLLGTGSVLFVLSMIQIAALCYCIS